MSNLNCQSCSKTFSTQQHCNSHICKDKVSKSYSVNDLNPSVLKDNTSLINTDILKRKSSDRIQPEIKKVSKMLKEIEDCSLDISNVISRTRKSCSTSSIDKKCSYSDDKEINDQTVINGNCLQVQIESNNHEFEVIDLQDPSIFSMHGKENSFEILTTKLPYKENLARTEELYSNETHSSDDKSPQVVNKNLSKSNNYESSSELENSTHSEHATESNSHRTDEIDRKAKSLNKLSFTCKDCHAEFETFNQFKTHQVIHDFESRKKVRPPSPPPDSESTTDYVSSSETLSEHTFPMKKRLLKRRKLESDALLSDPEPEEHQETFKCDECPKVFYLKQRLDKHKEIYHHHETVITTNPDPNFKPANDKYRCDNCAKDFPNVRAVKNHKLLAKCKNNLLDLKRWTDVNDVSEFGCGICGSGFDDLKKLQIHKESDHQNFQIPQKKSYR